MSGWGIIISGCVMGSVVNAVTGFGWDLDLA
jgi:hypothetical protein